MPDLDKMTKKPGSVRRELAEARRVVSAVDLRHPHPHDEAWRQEQLRLLAIEQKLAVAGITLDELIDLIDARREGRY